MFHHSRLPLTPALARINFLEFLGKIHYIWHFII